MFDCYYIECLMFSFTSTLCNPSNNRTDLTLVWVRTNMNIGTKNVLHKTANRPHVTLCYTFGIS